MEVESTVKELTIGSPPPLLLGTLPDVPEHEIPSEPTLPSLSNEEPASGQKPTVTIPAVFRQNETTEIGNNTISIANVESVEVHMEACKKLQMEIDRCKSEYRGKDFKVNCDEYPLEVPSGGIDKFFSMFAEGQ